MVEALVSEIVIAILKPTCGCVLTQNKSLHVDYEIKMMYAMASLAIE